MPGDGFFNRLSNELLEATNQIATRFDEGLSALLGDESSGATKGASSANFENGAKGRSLDDFEDVDLDGIDDEEIQRLIQEQMMDHSPLQGIADSVIGDIVSGQVRIPSPYLSAFSL